MPLATPTKREIVERIVLRLLGREIALTDLTAISVLRILIEEMVAEEFLLLYAELAQVLRPLVAGRSPDEHLFLHRKGGPIDQGQWPKDYWKTALRKLEIRHRKWYATRHTFISLSLTAGTNLTALARYCGTSVAMIDARYGRWNPGNERAILDRLSLPGVLKTQRSKALVAFRSKKRSENGASPTGFEPVSPA